MRIANIEEYIEQIKKEDIVQETEVRSKIVNPLLDLLRYPTENIAEEYPVYGKDGRKDLNTKSADIMIFKDSNANRHRDKKETGWVMNNSLVVFELKKPKEKIENAKDQATFYAMWTRCIVYVITNGNDIEIYKLKEYNADKLLFKDAEINECKEPKRSILKEYLAQINYERVSITEEAEEIANEIIDEGILNPKSFDDCLHIASAILNDCNIIVSWNFKHMVNVDTINGVRKITFAKRYNNIDIYAPYVLLSEKD